MGRAIPKIRLPHTIGYEKHSHTSTSESYAASVDIENVFFQRKTTRKPTGNGFQIVATVLILVDPISSSSTSDLATLLANGEQSRITFGGETFVVQEIYKAPDNVRAFHHWELICK